MTKKMFLLTMVLAALLFFPAQGQGKVRMAVMDFDTSALHGHWHYSWSWTQLSTAAADNLVTELVKSKKFSMIEREKLALIMQEHQLSASGAIDPKTAVQLGKLLGVQLIVTGSVTDFGVSEWGGRVPQVGKWKWGSGVGGKMMRGKASLNARLIDTTTGEIMGAYEASGDQQFGTGQFAGADFGKKFDTGMASKVLAESIDKLAAEIIKDADNITPSTGVPGSRIEGKIATISGSKIYINLGSSSGVKVGDVLNVARVGKEIRDPDTGEVLDVETTKVGTIVITEVKDKLSVASVQSGAGFKEGDIVKKD